VGFASEPDSPTGSQQGRDMDVSSGSEQQEHAAATVKRKKKHLTEDEMEAALAAKGASKAREWLESGFGGFKKVHTLRRACTPTKDWTQQPPHECLWLMQHDKRTLCSLAAGVATDITGAYTHVFQGGVGEFPET
jgi:hypothetical protein